MLFCTPLRQYLAQAAPILPGCHIYCSCSTTEYWLELDYGQVMILKTIWLLWDHELCYFSFCPYCYPQSSSASTLINPVYFDAVLFVHLWSLVLVPMKELMRDFIMVPEVWRLWHIRLVNSLHCASPNQIHQGSLQLTRSIFNFLSDRIGLRIGSQQDLK